MAQPSYEYALGRISVLSTHLLTAAQLRRIAEADSTKAAMKLLLETGYGENVATEQELAQGEIDLIIRAQMQLTRKRIQELTPDPELTGLFLLPVDTHNLKCLLKAAGDPGGRHPPGGRQFRPEPPEGYGPDQIL